MGDLTGGDISPLVAELALSVLDDDRRRPKRHLEGFFSAMQSADLRLSILRWVGGLSNGKKRR